MIWPCPVLAKKVSSGMEADLAHFAAISIYVQSMEPDQNPTYTHIIWEFTGTDVIHFWQYSRSINAGNYVMNDPGISIGEVTRRLPDF